MKTYSRLLIPVLIACVAANAAGTSLDAKHLIEIAERHDLPMPPAGARLVLAHTETWSVLGNQSTSRDPGIYSPAYMLKEDADGSIRVLRGAEQDTLEARHNQEPLWRPFSTDKVEPKLGGHVASFSRLSAFVCAVQTAALGDQETAQAIWERFSGGEWWSDARFGEDIAKQLKDQKLLLGRCIFDHMRNALLEAGADRQVIHTRMTALLKEFPTLKTDWRAQLYEDLTTTVKAAPPKAGSVEVLLLDWASRPSNMRHLGMHSPHTRAADAPAREILSRGLDAVPELLDLLKDQRVTAHEQQAFMKAPPRIKRVGELARQLVRQIAGDQATFPRYGDDTEAILAWWEKARTQDESTALLAGVFNRKDEKITGVNEGPIRIVAKKFPDKLPGLCEEFTAHATPDAQPYGLAEALAESSLPKEVRVRELSKFAERGSLEHKRCVLQNLAKLDAKACAALLLPIFAELPKDATGPYWTCPEANFTHVVVQIEDDEVWRAYLQVAKRCSIGLRMEMMNPLNYCYIGTKNLARRLAFLSAFLDDSAVREMSGEKGQFEGPCAGFTIPRLAVRDLSAMKLAALLGMKEAPDEFWTNDEWAELRRKVKEHLKDQKLPEL
jgi:hypothetical protein